MNIELTVDEIISTLKHSSLPTILVEGKDDMIIYRQIEQFFGSTKVNFQSCGCMQRIMTAIQLHFSIKD